MLAVWSECKATAVASNAEPSATADVVVSAEVSHWDYCAAELQLATRLTDTSAFCSARKIRKPHDVFDGGLDEERPGVPPSRLHVRET